MKLVAFSVALLAMTAAPAFAQMAPAPAATADAAASKFSLDTPIEAIAADPAGKAVLDADFPGLTTHEAYETFKGMSLAALQPMAGGKITDEQMAKAKVDLAAVK